MTAVVLGDVIKWTLDCIVCLVSHIYIYVCISLDTIVVVERNELVSLRREYGG